MGKTIETPHIRTNLIKTKQTLDAGRRMARECRDWMEKNKGAFYSIYGYIKSLQGSNVKGRVRDRVAVYCMTYGVSVDDDPYKFANGKFAGIARYMALIDPSLIGAPLRFNDSVIDCYGLLPISYLPGLGE